MCKSNFLSDHSIDIHTHILPKNLPKWSEKFGINGFVTLEHLNTGCARMMIDDVFFREIQSNCWDPDDRITDMNKFNTSVQVLSTVPVMFNYHIKPEYCLEVSKFLNDHISEICNNYPKKFLGLGTIPMQDSKLAVKELYRIKDELNIVGIQIGSNINDLNLGEERFFEIFEACEKLNLCVFVHPWNMLGQGSIQKYWLPWLVGMPAESCRAICSIIFSGIMEKLPNLRFAFAHGGGSFPFTLGRISHGFDMRPDLCAIDNNVNPKNYCGKFWVDSLVHDINALEYNIKLFGDKKIVLGSDYPFPLGELSPGSLIKDLNLNKTIKKKMLLNNALDWIFGN